MKIRQFLFLIVSIISLVSCEPPVTFTEPQPAGEKDQKQFPFRYRGKYRSKTDESILTITDKLLIRDYNLHLFLTKSGIDSTEILLGDSMLIETNSRDSIRVQVINDTINWNFHSRDTIFNLSSGTHLRKMNGYYFLNSPYGPENWYVQKIWLSKGKITIAEISSPDEIEKLTAISELPSDTTGTRSVFTPTKKQFKQFVKQNGFSAEEVFVKVK